jgi:Flp pilus assembly pilin Flp
MAVGAGYLAEMGTDMANLFDLIDLLKTLRKDSHGEMCLDYGLIAGFVAFALISSVNILGGEIAALYSRLAAANW